jgi:hypothetical protein
MEIELDSSHPKVAQALELGKCIPQASIVPMYVVSSVRLGEKTQYMRDHALILKFLGICPSERDLIKWINT